MKFDRSLEVSVRVKQGAYFNMENSEHFESRSRRGRQRVRTGTRPLHGSVGWIAVWIAASILPILPYAQPLWGDALADTPYAYLVWIPVFAFFWAGWSMSRTDAYKDDAELNGIMGVLLLLLSGALLVAGMTSWAGSFVGDSAGLLVWPLWALGLAWIMFGVGVTGKLVRPLLYLLLVWPPIYSWIVNVTNPILENLANASLTVFAHFAPWLRVSYVYGDYYVKHAGHWFGVQVSSVCSGSDSFLAMLILLPIILVLFEGTVLRKAILIGFAAVMSVVMNLLRLIILVISGHLVGSNFTFGTLHPVLGMILFVVTLIILALVGKLIGVRSKTVRATQSLPIPGWIRAGVAMAGALVLTVLLWPIYNWAAGSFGAPISVNTNNLSQLMPQMAGYNRSILGTFDEASVLGPGSYGRAFAYSNRQGGYMMAEEWWTYNLSALQSYGVNNCLLFHGYSVLGRQNFNVHPGVAAQAFAVLLPSNAAGGNSRGAFEDVAYIYAVKYKGRNAYIRAEFMTPIRYGVQVKGPLASVLPLALKAQYGASGSAAQTLSALPTLTAPERNSLQAFDFFVRTFARQSMKTVVSTAPISTAPAAKT